MTYKTKNWKRKNNKDKKKNTLYKTTCCKQFGKVSSNPVPPSLLDDQSLALTGSRKPSIVLHRRCWKNDVHSEKKKENHHRNNSFDILK